MNELRIREELYSFYLRGDGERAQSFAEKCFKIMDERYVEGMSVTAQKLLQYDVIVEEFNPVVFRRVPYFYETGVLTSLSDGSKGAKGYGFLQANGWVYNRNCHLFDEQDALLKEQRKNHSLEKLYLICGPYNDTSQHFNFNNRPILEMGLKGLYEKAKEELKRVKNSDEEEFLNSVCHGMLALRRMAEKFASKASEMAIIETEQECKENLLLISRTAKRIPWEAPQTLYEALATLAFLRTALGSLEGVGPNTFGRVDKDLIEFYRADVKMGRLNSEKAYQLICQFLLIWDCHYDHDMPMVGYADHELENTYVLGGCDDEGLPLYNELTEMFLRATREKKIVFPKIKARYSKDSPKEYLNEICKAIIKGTSAVLIVNDDAIIPAMLRAGRTMLEARDYFVTGCWGMASNQEKSDHGSYMNLLKAFEFSIHNLTEKMEKTGLWVETIDNKDSFEDIYQKTLRNCELLIDTKLDITRRGGQIFHKVDRLPIFSSTLENCLENRKDFTMRGAKYSDDYLLMFGLPNIVDSLLAIKTLVYDKNKYSLKEILTAVRCNWEGYEEMRMEAIACPGWGDGSEESCELANRFNNDLFAICQKKVGTYGGKVHMGHLTYTEIRYWGEQTLAFPDGRKNGEYFAQGLTPSRLKRIPCVHDVVNSLAKLDPSTMAANSVVNIILPKNITLDYCETFLRVAARTALQSLQLNCTSKEELLDAQKHPEKYPDLIVRVTGFSAKFTSLSPEWQQEVISRNFYNS